MRQAPLVQPTLTSPTTRTATLDGMRGVAILLVIVSHLGVPGTRGAGFVGVTLFFVLSGFLITRLLVRELDATGTIRLGEFYVRRAARLLPAFALLLAVTAVLIWVTGSSWLPLLLSAAYLADYINVLGINPGFLAHTWSLALEEQFYIIWPLAVLCLPRRWWTRTLVAGFLAVTTARILLASKGLPVWVVHNFRPEIRADAIILGCLLAIFIGRIPPRALRIAAPLSAVVLLALTPTSSLGMGWMLTPAAIASAALVGWGATGAPGALTRVLSLRPLTYVGRISYGLYLWHYPPMVFKARAVGMTAKMEVALVGVVAAFAIAALSWRYLEQPIMAWSRQRQDVRATPAIYPDPLPQGLA